MMATVTLAWDAVPATTDPATNPIGYKLYTGVASGTYGTPIDVGNVMTTNLTLQGATTYYFVVTAYNAATASPLRFWQATRFAAGRGSTDIAESGS